MLISIGGFIKWVAAILTILFLIVGFVMAKAVGNYALIVGGIGLAVGMPTFVLGILITGQGQTHLATLDTAVNTSRHLSKDDVAAIVFG